MSNADLMIAAARDAIGTPFRHQGRTVGQGIDCAGLMVHSVKATGRPVADQANYSRRAGGAMLEAALDAQPSLTRVYAGPLQAADIVLIKFEGDPCHLALFTGNSIIHAWAVARKVCEHDFTPEWQGYVVRAYRVNEDG